MIKHILVVMFAVLISGCTAKHLNIFPPLNDPSLIKRKLSVDAMHQDIDAFINGVIMRHPAIEEYTDLAQLREFAELYKNEITSPLTRVEFYQVIGKLTHHLNDGHSLLIWPYQEYELLKEDGNKPFPFDVVITKDKEILLKHGYTNGNAQLPAGTNIVEINDIPAKTLINTLQQYTSGETRYLREQVVAARFALTLWSAMGLVNDFKLTLLSNKTPGTRYISKDQNWEKITQSSEQKDHYYKRLTANVGLLYLAHFDIDPDEFEDFLAESFSQIKKDEITQLIIDIRDNPGGNTDTVTELSRYLADKPFRLVSRLTEKLNMENRGLFNYKGEVGEIIETEWTEWEDPVSESKRFKGDAYLLISPVSYSSAIVLATTLQDNKFATLVGESTGGFANQTAQGNLFNLPNSQLRAYVTTRLLVRPNGDIKRQVVTPDHHVYNTIEDIKAGRDAAVEFIINKTH